MSVRDTGTVALILERAVESGLDDDAQIALLAACQGDAQLDDVLATVQTAAPPSEPTGARAEPMGAYLQAIAVQAFRGIGPRATLRLQPGPGLTLVVGRNGSGKSSYAEAAEIALTGKNARWAGRGAVWKEGWRNLHTAEPPRVEIEVVVEGQPGVTRVRRHWNGDDVDTSSADVMVPGRSPQPLSALGWEAALVTYRPFLSYAELGSLVTGKPSEMYDAIASILGLGVLADAERRLADRKRDFEAATRYVKEGAAQVRRLLEAADDARARTALAVLKARTYDLDAIAGVVFGPAGEADPELASLRQLADLSPPDEAEHELAVRRLHSAVSSLEEVHGTEAGDAMRLVRLLEAALEHRERHDDATCPVCGAPDRLDTGWVQSTREEVARLRARADAAAQAEDGLRLAIDFARAIARPLPSVLARDSTTIDVEPARSAWKAWVFAREIDDATKLAEHLARTFPAVRDACTTVRRQAAQEVERRRDRWQPVAQELAVWLEQARTQERRRHAAVAVQKAHKWLKATALDIRNERLQPLAEASRHVWQELRQESSVDLGPIRLEGASTRRRVMLDVSVDGVGGAALGVMSQGELHALGLALFLPRATVPDSPFRFLVIDDPVQSMDPAKVDGLARVLVDAATDRQVVVFTHDDRLPEAIRRQQLPATIWQVVRREQSEVELVKADDPVSRCVRDARALASTEDLPAKVAAVGVVGLCRHAVEAACLEVVRRRRLGRGQRHAELENHLRDVRTLHQLAAFALFDDPGQGGNVLRRLNGHDRRAADAFVACKTGVHEPYDGDLPELISNVERLVAYLLTR